MTPSPQLRGGLAPLADSVLQAAAQSGRPAAFVLGTATTGLSVARALSALGVVVIGVDARSYFPQSYSSAWHTVMLGADFDDAGLVTWLTRECRRFSERPVLFASTDEQVKLLAIHGQHLSAVVAFEQSTASSSDLLMNKRLFTDRAREASWPVPKTWLANSRTQLQMLADEMVFPVILKPEVKNLGFRTSAPAKAFRCETPSDLLTAYDSFSQSEPEAIVQEWIVGGDGDIRFSFHYLTAEGQELVRFEGRKIRQWLPECGSSASATRCDEELVADLSVSILRACGAVGFCSVEYKRDRRTGKHVIMEPTIGRPNLQLGAALANGIDLVRVAYEHLAGLPMHRPRPTRRRATWLIVPSDLRSAQFYRARGDLTWFGWWESLSWPLVPAVWRLTDWGMLAAFVQKAGRYVRRRLGLIP